MRSQQANPLDLLLEEAEEAARPRPPPLVVGRHPQPRVAQDPEDIVSLDSVLLEWEDRPQVRLRRDVARAVLVGSDRDVAVDDIIPDILLEGFQLEELRAPAHLRGWEEPAEDLVPVVEVAVRIKAHDRLPGAGLER